MQSATTAQGEAIPFLDLRTQHRELRGELVAAFEKALDNAAFVGGSEVEEFEREFAQFIGVPHVAGLNSGTDALRFAYMAMGVEPGDEIITVPNTFIATTEAITQAGGVVRFVDVDRDTLTMDPAGLSAAITPRTVGVVPVHLYGQPADLDPIMAIARRHHLWVVEDAAQAHGAQYKGKSAGSIGDLAGFSFYPGKNLGACGEAGATAGADAARMEVIRRLREHGQTRKYYHATEGYNGRLDAIQAAFLRIKLRRLPAWIEGRRRAAGWYRDALAGIDGIRVPLEVAYAKHVYHIYVIHAERRDELQRHLTELHIGTGLHYPKPLHLQDAYKNMGLREGAFPVTEASAAHLLSLPMFPELTQAQVERVGQAVRAFYR